MVVLDCDLSGAKSLMQRLLKWAFGEYTIHLGSGKGEIKIKVDASLGMAEWKLGEAMEQVVERADAEMYREKALAHKQRS
jgi:GGDEF domain-containing protein